MPDLFFPISFGKFSLQNHLTSSWIYDQESNRIISGAFNGDMIIWQLNQSGDYQPSVHLSPHLIYSVGSVTCLQIVKRPFSEFQDYQNNWCLLSIHQDKRVRLWNLEDGKLFVISDHDPFVNTTFIDKVQHLGEKFSRYVVCSGISNSIYIFDLWKMCCSRVYQIQEAFEPPIFSSVIVLNKFEICAISSKSLVYKIDVRHYQNPEKQDYMKYIDKKNAKTEKKNPKAQKIRPDIRMTSAHSLQELRLKRVKDSYFNEISSTMVLLQSKEIIFIHHPFKEQERQKDIIIMRGQMRKFKKVWHINTKESVFIFQCNSGGLISIYEKDILQLFETIKSSGSKSINYSFDSFNFMKQPFKSVGILSINMSSFLNATEPSQYVFQQDILIYTNEKESYLIKYSDKHMDLFNLDDGMNYDQFSICKYMEDQNNFWDTQLISEGLELHIFSKSVYVNHKIKPCLLKPYNTIIFENIQFSPELGLLNQQGKYYERIKELLINEKCSSQTLAVVDKLKLMFFMGTAKGTLYGFPFFYNKEGLYETYVCDCSDKPLVAILYYKNNLFIQDTQNMLFVFNLQNLINKGLEGFKVSQLRPNFQQSLTGIIKRRLKIRSITTPIFYDKKGWQSSSQQMSENNSRYIREIIVFQLQDDSLILFSTKNNKITLQFPYVFDKETSNEIMNVYYHTQLNKYIIVNQNLASLWLADSGILERILPLQQIAELFQLDSFLDQFLNPHVNCNDFKIFQNIAISTSACFDLLEFQFRSFNNQLNYRKELSSKSLSRQLNYESLGLLFKMKGQSVGFSDLLNIVNHNPQSIIYKDHKSGVIIFQREQKKVLKPFLLHQAYQLQQDKEKIQGMQPCKSFHKLNKHYTIKDSFAQQLRTFVIWFDAKKNLEFVRGNQSKVSKEDFQLQCFNFYPNQYLVPQTPQSVFRCNLGVQGLGEGQSCQLHLGKWRQSGLMTTQYLISQTLFIHNTYKDAQTLVQTTMSVYKSLEFTDRNGSFRPSLQSLVRYCLDQDREIIDICSQMIRSLIQDEKQGQKIQASHLMALQFSSNNFLKYLKKQKDYQTPTKFLPFEILCLIMQVQIGLVIPAQDNVNYIFSRIIQGINQQNCIAQSNLIVIFLRLLNDGITTLVQTLDNPRNLFFVLICQIYYPLNTIAKYQIYLNEIFSQQRNKKSNHQKEQEKDQLLIFNKFQTLSPQQNEQLRHSLLDLVTNLAHSFEEEFMSIVEDFIFENDQFYLLPCTILDIARKYCKRSPKSNQLYILIFVELAVKTQDQNNSVLKRYTKISVMKLFKEIEPHFKYLSYSEGNQKLAFSVAHSILVYDLIQGVKITQLDRIQSEISSISFDPQGQYLASFSYKDLNLMIFKISSLGISKDYETFEVKQLKMLSIVENQKDEELFQKIKEENIQIRWDNYSQYIYLDWQMDSKGFLVFHKI